MCKMDKKQNSETQLLAHNIEKDYLPKIDNLVKRHQVNETGEI